MTDRSPLAGVLTADDASDIAEDEATEDAERQGGSQPLEVPYLSASPWLLWRKRIPWLLALFLAEGLGWPAVYALMGCLMLVIAVASLFAPEGRPTSAVIAADAATLDRLEGEGQVAFRYAEPVNGSARDIAGVLSDGGNVLGMMPHPERAVEDAHGNRDGLRLFEGLLSVIA